MGAESSAEAARKELAEYYAYARKYVTHAQALVDAYPSSSVSDVQKSYMLALLERDPGMVHLIMKDWGLRYTAIKVKTERVQPWWPLAKHHYTGAVRFPPNDKTRGDEDVSAEAAAVPAASVSAAAAPSQPQSQPLGSELELVCAASVSLASSSSRSSGSSPSASSLGSESDSSVGSDSDSSFCADDDGDGPADDERVSLLIKKTQ